MFPEIAVGVDRSEDRKAIRRNELSAFSGFPELFNHSYYDHIVLKKGKDGEVLFVDSDEYPLVIYGKFGRGKVLVSGMASGLSCPSGIYSNESVGIADDEEKKIHS